MINFCSNINPIMQTDILDCNNNKKIKKMILIIKKKKIACQMGVAASLKVKVCWKFELIRVHVGVSELTQNN